MGYFELIAPRETTNLVIAPSVEWGTLNTVSGVGTAYGTVHNCGSAALTPTTGTAEVLGTAFAFRGAYAYRWTQAGTAPGTIYYGPKVNLGSALTAKSNYAVSAYARPIPSAGTLPGTIYATLDGTATWDTGTTTYALTEIESEGTAWKRYGATVVPTVQAGGTSLALLNIGAVSVGYYLDCIQVEPGTVTTYLDHDVPGATFTGLTHYSITERRDSVRSGGIVKKFDEDYGVNVMNVSGHQAPPNQQSSQSRAALDGSMWLKTRVNERPIQLGCSIEGSSLEDYHQKRDAFFYDIQRDLVSPVQPFVLRYRGAGKTVELPVVYDGGMEGGEMLGPCSEAFPLRVIAFDDPFWTEIKQGGAVFNNSTTLAVEQMVAYKPSGKWSTTNGYWGNLGAPERTYDEAAAEDATQNTYALAKDKNGNLYVGGHFYDIGGIEAADHVAKMSPEGTWSALADGITESASAAIKAIAVATDNTVYLGGVFTDLVDGNGYYITKWNGSAFSSLGTGANGQVRALLVARDGTLYAGGNFTSMGGVASTKYIAKWNGAAWSALGTGGDSAVNGVWAIAEDEDGNIIVGGDFSNMGGVAAADYIAKWNGTAWSSIGVFDNAVYALTVDYRGILYAGGKFTTIDGETRNAIASYNGGLWSAMSSGIADSTYTAEVDCVAVTRNGLVYIGGIFDSAGGSTVDRCAVWNGTTWSALPITLPDQAAIPAIATPQALLADENDIYIGFNTEGTATLSGLDSANGYITNPGTAKAWPVITVHRSGGTSASFRGLRNESTGKEISMVHAMQDGEMVVLDLRPGRKKFFRYFPRINLLSEINPASDLATWCLKPGENKIGVFCPGVGSPTITIRMYWDTKHWSVDGGAH